MTASNKDQTGDSPSSTEQEQAGTPTPDNRVWVFDSNYRVYVDGEGVKHTAPIYREHWRPHEIVSETSRSYVLDNGQKITKNVDKRLMGVAMSLAEVNQQVWIHENARYIADKVRELPFDKLMQVNDLLGSDRRAW